jgi:hypothetical protein
MNDVLSNAIKAHGGMERWRLIAGIRVKASITGAIWFVKGQGDVLKDVEFVVDTDRQRVAMDFPGQDKHTVFEPDLVIVEAAQGEVTKASDNPVKTFEGQTLESPWDDIHVAYFSGEALWTYLNVPFLFARPGFQTEEIAPIVIEGETCRRLKVSFPENIKSHNSTQFFSFGPDGLLRRHDYTVDVLGGAHGSNYAYDYRNIDGIMIPTTRLVYGYDGDFQTIREPVLVEIHMREVNLI